MTLRTWAAVGDWLAGSPAVPWLEALAGRLTPDMPGIWVRVGAQALGSPALFQQVMDAVSASLLAGRAFDGAASGDALEALVEALSQPEARTLEWTVVVGASDSEVWPDVSEAVSQWLASLAAVVAASLRPIWQEAAHA